MAIALTLMIAPATNAQTALTHGRLANIIDDIMQYRTLTDSTHSMYQNELTQLNKKASKSISQQDAVAALEQTLYIDFAADATDATATEEYIDDLIAQHVQLIVSEADVYTKSVTGNVIVNVANTTFRDMTIDGDLIIAQGVGDGELTLENTVVTGKIIAATESKNHINFINSTADGGVQIDKYAYNLNIAGDGITKVELNTAVTVYGTGAVSTTLTFNNGLTGKFQSAESVITPAGTEFLVQLDGYTSMATGYHISHVEPMTLATGRGVAGASKDGSVVAYDNAGKFIWHAKAGETIINGLEVADIDGDGFDEVLAASTDGRLYAFDHDGTALWTYETGETEDSRGVLYAVACAKMANGEMGIFFGGVSKTLYQVDKNGNLVNSVPLALASDGKKVQDEMVITLDTGMRADGTEYVVMVSSPAGNYTNSVSIIDPNNIGVDAMHTTKSPSKNYIGRQDTADIDFDGVNEILYNYEPSISSMGNFWVAEIDYDALVDYNTKTKKPNPDKAFMAEYVPELQGGRGYRMGALSFVDGTTIGKTQADSFIINLDASRICEYSTDGKLLGVHLSRFSYNDGTYDPKTGLFYLAAEQSGGDVIRIIDLKNDNWREIFMAIEAEGLLSEIIDNLVLTNKLVDAFVAPAYQDLSQENYLSITTGGTPEENLEKEAKIAPNGNIGFATNEWTWTENYDRDAILPANWAAGKDKRKKYDMTQAEIWAAAEAHEANGEKFSIWTGHGTDPFYMQPETVLGIIERAPNTLEYLIFSELTHIDEYLMQNYFIPMANACQEQGRTKIFLRNKNSFWNGNVHMPEWYDLIAGDYSNVIIPTMEETNSRAQELSLSARVGLWMSGAASSWGGRLIEDNTNYVRHIEHGLQRVLSHQMRSFAYQIANGADSFQNTGGTKYEDQFDMIHKMVDQQILLVGQRDTLLSVPDIAIGMLEPSEEFVSTFTFSHAMDQFDPANTETFVYDGLRLPWSGAPIKDHDFGGYGLGAKTRTLNFLPSTPYGMVPEMSAYLDISDSRFATMLKTDGKFWYDEAGIAHSPDAYKDTVIAALEASAAKMPVVVASEDDQVAWTVTKIDDTHARILLIDGGYVTPSNRVAQVKIQNVAPKTATNILTGEIYSIANNEFSVAVPAGVFSIVDVEFVQPLDDYSQPTPVILEK